MYIVSKIIEFFVLHLSVKGNIIMCKTLVFVYLTHHTHLCLCYNLYHNSSCCHCMDYDDNKEICIVMFSIVLYCIVLYCMVLRAKYTCQKKLSPNCIFTQT